MIYRLLLCFFLFSSLFANDDSVEDLIGFHRGVVKDNIDETCSLNLYPTYREYPKLLLSVEVGLSFEEESQAFYLHPKVFQQLLSENTSFSLNKYADEYLFLPSLHYFLDINLVKNHNFQQFYNKISGYSLFKSLEYEGQRTLIYSCIHLQDLGE